MCEEMAVSQFFHKEHHLGAKKSDKSYIYHFAGILRQFDQIVKFVKFDRH